MAASLSESLTGAETFAELHGSLVHTLGNLTLTGYNSTMSNKPFDVKREQFHKSGLAMNQEIARESRWGRAEITPEPTILRNGSPMTWPGPVDAGPDETGASWDIMAKALAGIPAGAWTTYGDLAALIGSHPVRSESGWLPIRYQRVSRPAS